MITELGQAMIAPRVVLRTWAMSVPLNLKATWVLVMLPAAEGGESERGMRSVR